MWRADLIAGSKRAAAALRAVARSVPRARVLAWFRALPRRQQAGLGLLALLLVVVLLPHGSRSSARLAVTSGTDGGGDVAEAACVGTPVERDDGALAQATGFYDAGDLAEAARRFCWLGRQGDDKAALYLGAQYEFGRGIAPDLGSAAYWYGVAAERGNAAAQKNLGNLYENGSGVAEDWLKAAAWHRRSAEAGYADGEYALGRDYEYGIGVPQDRDEALAWYSKAAQQGIEDAVFAAHQLDADSMATSFRTPEERAIIGFRYYRPPAGMTFRNAAERIAYLQQQARANSESDAWSRYRMEQDEYQRCERQGGRYCREPTPP